MQLKCDLEQPLLKQAKVKEFLNLPLDKTASKINIEELVKIAQGIMRAELITCGHDENELVSIQLKYKVPGQGNQKTELFSVEWRLSDQNEEIPQMSLQSLEKVEKIDEVDQKFPVSLDSLSRLTKRLDEAFVETSTGASTASWNFQFSSFGQIFETCDGKPDCLRSGVQYKSIYKNGKFVGCGSQCELPQPAPPD
jgi:hypothetical protein